MVAGLHPDPKDPQLHARVRRESEAKRKIAEAERGVLSLAEAWAYEPDSPGKTLVLHCAITTWVNLRDAKTA